MVYSDTTGATTGAIQYCEDLCQQGDGGISGNTSLLKRFTRWINIGNSQVWHLLFSINGGWKYDDSNYSDLPQATQTMTSGTQLYALPSAALTIDRVEVTDVNGVNQIVHPITLEQIEYGVNSFFTDAGLPQYYRLIGSTIQLFPAPDNNLSVTLTNGLKVYFVRSSVSFSYSDTTKSFGFASEYHDIPARKGAIEWYKIYKPDSPTLKVLLEDDQRRIDELQEYETAKWHDVKQVMKPRRYNYR